MHVKKLFLLVLFSFPVLHLLAQPAAEALPNDHYFQLRGGIPNAFHAFAAGKKATVAFLGGSITYNPGWRNMICTYLRDRFFSTDFNFIAAGIPSLGSVPHAFRLQRDILDSGEINLLFVEAAVNDRVNGTDSLTQLRALEGIVRHARKVYPRADIVLMAFADPLKSADYDRGAIPAEVANQERIASHYRLPSINLAKEVHDRIQHHEFDWEHDFKDLHPSPFGQEVYFHTMRKMLDKCFDSARTVSRFSEYRLPEPVISGSLDNGRYAGLSDAVTTPEWRMVNDWTPFDSLSTRPGFVHVPVLEAVKPGASLLFSFKGNAVGLCIVSGADAGRISYSVDNGESRTMDLFTEWSHSLHLPWYVLLADNLQPGQHQLRVAISGDSNADSKGHACRIVHFLVN